MHCSAACENENNQQTPIQAMRPESRSLKRRPQALLKAGYQLVLTLYWGVRTATEKLKGLAMEKPTGLRAMRSGLPFDWLPEVYLGLVRSYSVLGFEQGRHHPA